MPSFTLRRHQQQQQRQGLETQVCPTDRPTDRQALYLQCVRSNAANFSRESENKIYFPNCFPFTLSNEVFNIIVKLHTKSSMQSLPVQPPPRHLSLSCYALLKVGHHLVNKPRIELSIHQGKAIETQWIEEYTGAKQSKT